jgi:signal transduction histidine kinase
MPVRTRLILTILAISVALALPAIFGAFQLGRFNKFAERQRTTHGAALIWIGRLQTSLSDLDRLSRQYGAVADPADSARIADAFQEADRQVDSLDVTRYRGAAKTTRDQLTGIRTILSHAIQLRSMQAEREEADHYFEQVKRDLLPAALLSLDSIAKVVDARAQDDLQNATNVSRWAWIVTLVTLLGALGVAFVLGFWTTRVVTTPLRRLRRGMARVAAENYVVPEDLPYQRRDEIGDLARSFSWMTQHLAKLDKMKAEFISIATHELKTPINVITGYTELVDEGLYGELTADQRQALHAIRDQAHGLTRLVNQLLDVSRLEAGGLQLAMNEVIIEDLMDNLERSFGILAQKKDITLTFTTGHNVPRSIQADPDRLRDQVLSNLLANSLKFTAEGGHVSVRVWGDGPALHIEVSDTGVGIASDQLPYVFDKYYQVGQARSKGAGLGLAIARDIIEAHGGNISVESAENVGTTFRIELPVRQPEPDAEEVPAAVGANEP